MFSQVISNAAQLADQITAQPALPDAGFVVQHVSQFRAEDIPALRDIASRTAVYAAGADATISMMLDALAQGATPESLAPHLRGIQAGIADLDGRTKAENDRLSETRDRFNADAGQLANMQINLRAQAEGLQGKQQDLMRQAQKLQDEIDAMNVVVWIPIIGPIIKGASELVHLIADHKTAEDALSDATNELGRVNQQIAMLQGMAAQTQQLQALIGQLGNGTQNLANTMAMLRGTLDNEADFLNGVGDAPKLFLTAAQFSVRQLATLVS